MVNTELMSLFHLEKMLVVLRIMTGPLIVEIPKCDCIKV